MYKNKIVYYKIGDINSTNIHKIKVNINATIQDILYSIGDEAIIYYIKLIK